MDHPQRTEIPPRTPTVPRLSDQSEEQDALAAWCDFMRAIGNYSAAAVMAARHPSKAVVATTAAPCVSVSLALSGFRSPSRSRIQLASEPSGDTKSGRAPT